MDIAAHALDMAVWLEPKDPPYGVINTLNACAEEITRLRAELAEARSLVDGREARVSTETKLQAVEEARRTSPETNSRRPFHTEPGPGRRFFGSIGYSRGPASRIYIDETDGGAMVGWVVEALNDASERMAERFDVARSDLLAAVDEVTGGDEVTGRDDAWARAKMTELGNGTERGDPEKWHGCADDFLVECLGKQFSPEMVAEISLWFETGEKWYA